MEVIDLSESIPTTGHSARQPNKPVLSRFAPRHRLLGVSIVLVLGLAGLRVHAVHAPATVTAVPDQPGTTVLQPPAPDVTPLPAAVPIPKGPAARRTDGSLLTGTDSRLLLLGTTLTTYDVASGVAARPLADDTGATVIGAAGLTDGDVVIESLGESSGRAYAVVDGRRSDLGIATEAVAGLAVDTAWLVDEPESAGPTRVRLVDLAGDLLAGPFAIPADWRLERAVPGGVLLAIGDARAPYALHLWTPGSTSPGPLLASNVVTDASGADQVLTVGADGAVDVNGTPVDLPGDALAYAVSPDGSTLAALDPGSIVLSPRASEPSSQVLIPLPAGSAPTALAFAPSGWLFATLGTRVVAISPGGTTVTALPAVFSDPPSDLLAAAAIAQPANPRTGR